MTRVLPVRTQTGWQGFLHAGETGSQAKAGVGRWITFHNHLRPHPAHGGQPFAVVYFNNIEIDQQVQAVAYVTRKSVQEFGNNSDQRAGGFRHQQPGAAF